MLDGGVAEGEESEEEQQAFKRLRPTFRISSAPEKDKDYKDGELQPGCKVRLHSLRVTKAVNGMEGTCEKFDSREGRWLVILTDGSTATVKPDNLEVLDTNSGKTRW